MKALLYCSKGKVNLYRPFEQDCFEQDETSKFYLANNPLLKEDTLLNGKIVAEVEINKVEEVVATKWDVGCGCAYYQFKTKDLLRKSCLKYIDLNDYLYRENGYALHLKNLKVFDKPKKLFEYNVKPKPFKTIDGYSITNITYSCTNAPQNMCNVYDNQDNHYVLISIQPQHLCKILNREKTIEVRKKVLNCLKELISDERN